MANDSEKKAIDYLYRCLKDAPGNDEWFLLTNLAHSVTHRMQSDEIDIVAIGPPGVRIIEVKHWSAEWMADHKTEMECEAELAVRKAKKLGTSLRRSFPNIPFVKAVILLTRDVQTIKRFSGKECRGAAVYDFTHWKETVELDGQKNLHPHEVRRASNILEPRSRVWIDGRIRRLAGYVNLEIQSPTNEIFHRIYKGKHSTRQDKVELHLYDLSANDDKNAKVQAEREFETLRRLQLYTWAPRILDSFQEVPGYSGEMYFFTLIDPSAPSIVQRSGDDAFSTASRIEFARKTANALAEMHSTGLTHRRLTPERILVSHENAPFITGFDRARIPLEVSVTAATTATAADYQVTAPEVIKGGLAAADFRSDVYALCASLKTLFQSEDPLALRTLEILASGTADVPEDRVTLDEMRSLLDEELGISPPEPSIPPARFWTEGQVIRFKGSDYRIVSKLGSGGFGTAYRVVEIARSTKEDVGAFVAKVCHDKESGDQTIKAYALARQHSARQTGLSTILEVAGEWRENDFVSLMTWIEGAPLEDFIGVFPLLAEDLRAANGADLAVRWIKSICNALDALHSNGLIHGDVSPRNLIVSGKDLVLTDFDFVTKVGAEIPISGTVMYCAPHTGACRQAMPGDDIYALAASLFRVVYDKLPFGEDDPVQGKSLGLDWGDIDTSENAELNAFLLRATDPEPGRRFADVSEVENFFEEQTRVVIPVPEQMFPINDASIKHVQLVSTANLSGQNVKWLNDVFRSYPGYSGGNQETRGLDSKFAADTYVKTELERTLLQDILENKTRLVILCGNAGDGKTALLQHLAERLGLGVHTSANRVIKGKTESGLRVRINLDGSAAWEGRTADELLDSFLEPFQCEDSPDNTVHLLAINDGRLKEWIEGYEGRHGDDPTPLTSSLRQQFEEENPSNGDHMRFLNLNQRSLVGDISSKQQAIRSEFLDQIINRLYGGDQTEAIWVPCTLCLAKSWCEIYRAGRLFAPDGFPDPAPPERRRRARLRLAEALQAVHLRGEIHITVRELRAALVYILFGINPCQDFHDGENRDILPYWDRAFHADSPARQGELLHELLRFDPALDAHPKIDRYIINESAFNDESNDFLKTESSLASRRRRAFFEWTDTDAKRAESTLSEIGLAGGRHLELFRDLPIFNEAKKHDICRDLCRGISQLENLPPKALDRDGVVPLRITPRTPTETAFWVEKRLSSFRLEAVCPQTDGVGLLHRQAVLVYSSSDGREERLRLGAELFHLLLDLSDGYQLGDISTDETFANLLVFTQRLIQEDAGELLAWSPMDEETVYRVAAEREDNEGTVRQYLHIAPLSTGERL